MAKLVLVPIYLGISILSLLSLGLYILGGVRYLTDLESNTCDLTYMFEYPQYVRIKLDSETTKKYPAFALYVYGEGYTTERLRRNKFNGIPVLFIPGNAGSHEQVRSIASVSLRMAQKRRTPFHFDYYTVSLADGYSALYGGVLEEQTVFVSSCIRQILNLYNGKVDQIVLIGHSMGGIVAKAALLHDPAVNTSLASILINLASPHLPRVAFDKTFADYYHKINSQAKRLKEMGTSVISIGGGPRDLMVTSSQIVNPHADLNIISTSIPNVWRSLDHLSILWCKQFVIVLNHALFDCVNYIDKIPKITTNATAKLQALTYHLARRYSIKHLPPIMEKINFLPDGQWIEINTEQYTLDNWNAIKRKQNQEIYFIIPLRSANQQLNQLSIDIFNVEAKNWLFGCTLIEKNPLKACKWGWNLTNRTIRSPDYQHRLRKSVDLEPKELPTEIQMTHIVIRIPADDIRKKTPPIIHIDMYSRDLRIIRVNISGPTWLPSFMADIIAAYHSTVIKITRGSIRQFIAITGVTDAVNIMLEAIIDNEKNYSPGYVIIQMVESTNSTTIISQFYILNEKDIGRTNTLRLQTDSDTLSKLNKIEMIMSFDPRFSYRIRLRRAGLIDRIANFVRDRWHRLYPVTIGVLLLTIATRIDNTQYKISVAIIITGLASVWFGLYAEICVALGLLLVFGIATCCGVVFSGSMAHNLTARFLARALARLPVSWYGWLLRQDLEHLKYIATFFMIVLVSSSCAAVVMLLSVVIYFLTLTRMYEDYLEKLLMASFRGVASRFRKTQRNQIEKQQDEDNVDPTTNIINHLLLFMTWCLTAGSAIPTTLVWAKNYCYESRLSTEDTIMFISWVVLTGWGSLGLVKIPSTAVSERDRQRVQLITLIERLLGWALIWIAGSTNPADYQWSIPPIIAIFISTIVVLSWILRTDKAVTYNNEELCNIDNEKKKKQT